MPFIFIKFIKAQFFLFFTFPDFEKAFKQSLQQPFFASKTGDSLFFLSFVFDEDLFFVDEWFLSSFEQPLHPQVVQPLEPSEVLRKWEGIKQAQVL